MERNRLAVLIAGIALLAVAGAGVAAGIGTPATTAHDSPVEETSDRSITVDATGEAEAAPDTAILDVAVTVEGDNQSEVRGTLVEDATGLRATLDSLGVAYETTHYSIERTPRSEERDRPPYRAVHAFEVRLNETDRAGEIADAAVDAGADVQGIEFTLSEQTRNDLRDDAIENAMADARQQADTIAGTTDLDVSSVLTVDATQRSFDTRTVEYAAASDGAAGGATTVDSGDVSVTYDVTVTYSAVGETVTDSGSASGESGGANDE